MVLWIFQSGVSADYHFQRNRKLSVLPVDEEIAKWCHTRSNYNEFRVGGFHEGKKILKGNETGILKDKGTFNRKVNIIDNQYERPLITHCLYEMYEGNTVSYIIENTKNDKILYFGKDEDLKMITDPKVLFRNGSKGNAKIFNEYLFMACCYRKT